MDLALCQAKVYIPSDQVSLRYLQSCVVPKRFLPSDHKTGDIVQVSIQGSEYLCKLVLSGSSDMVVVSDVAVRKNIKQPKEQFKITKLVESQVPIDTLILEVYLDEKRFKLLDHYNDPAGLRELVRNLCGMVVLRNGYNIELSSYKIFENWGIVRLENIDTNTNECPGTVSSSTNIIFRNIRCGKDIPPEISPLGGLTVIRSSIEAELLSKGRRSSNMLLIGPSGCGKTSLIRSIAASLDINLFDVASQVSSVTGDNPLQERIEKIISLCKITNRPNIVLIEDVEQFCPKESNDKRQLGANIGHSILQCFDRLSECNNISIICTTRNVESISNKLRRPGRLDRDIYFKVPNEEQRREIVEFILKDIQEIDRTLIDFIAAKTPAFLGGDILSLVNVARRNMRGHTITITDIEKALLTVRPVSVRINSYLVEKDPSLTLDALGGLLELKKKLQSSIFRPLQHPEPYLRYKLSLPKGILMYGPPGCAKTTVAKCLANEMNRHLIAVSAAQIYSPYVGDSEQILAQIFHQARMCAPSIIFIDEIDSIVGSRSMDQKKRGGSDVQTKLLSTLLIEMDGVGLKVQSNHNPENHILIIGATNRPDSIDDALMRPGRFDRLIYVPAPNEEERTDILRRISKNMPLSEDVQFELLAKETRNYSGADLVNLCNETALEALTLDQAAQQLSLENFMSTLKKLKPSLTNAQLQWYEEYELNR